MKKAKQNPQAFAKLLYKIMKSAKAQLQINTE